MLATLAAAGIGSFYARYYALHAAALALLVLAVVVGRRRIPPWLRLTVLGLVSVLLVRLVLFDNPLALRIYQRRLTADIVGPRQWAVLELDIAKYRRNLSTPVIENVAVGSSQVGAIFSHWVSTPPQPLMVYSMAGMKTLDYILNERDIADLNPARVILYLSAFDLTAGPELYSLPMAPSHPLHAWDVVSRLHASGVSAADADGPIHAFIASQLFPEYRYSFIFKALVKPWVSIPLGVVARGPAPVETPRLVHASWLQEEPATVLDEQVRRHITEFVGYDYPEWLDYNFGFLKAFVAFCQSRGISVVIAEGQVSPIIRSPKVDMLNAMVRLRFAELELTYPNVEFVPARDIYQFDESDYVDLTHVNRPAAMKYTERLSAYLKSADTPPLNGACGVTFLGGWYGREETEGGWLRWSNGTGKIMATARQPLDLVMTGEVLSYVRPNSVGIVVEGRTVDTMRIDDPAWVFHPMPQLRMHLDGGQSLVLSVNGDAAAQRPTPTDARMLAIALKNLTIRTADGAVTCEVTPDAPVSRRKARGIAS